MRGQPRTSVDTVYADVYTAPGWLNLKTWTALMLKHASMHIKRCAPAAAYHIENSSTSAVLIPRQLLWHFLDDCATLLPPIHAQDAKMALITKRKYGKRRKAQGDSHSHGITDPCVGVYIFIPHADNVYGVPFRGGLIFGVCIFVEHRCCDTVDFGGKPPEDNLLRVPDGRLVTVFPCLRHMHVRVCVE